VPAVGPLLELFRSTLDDARGLVDEVRSLTAEVGVLERGLDEQFATRTVLEEELDATSAERDALRVRLAAAESLITELRGEDQERLAVVIKNVPTSWERLLRADLFGTTDFRSESPA
jgi:hypothetical protein